jgi:hypothetical protein
MEGEAIFLCQKTTKTRLNGGETVQRRISLIVVLFGFILGFACAMSAGPRECGSNSLPPAAQTLLAQRFPTWTLVTPSDLSPDDQKLWSENYGDQCPGVIEGNFAIEHSFAVSLIHKENATLLQTLVLIELSQHGYALRTLSEASTTAVPNVLLKFPPGTYKDAERTRSVQTKFDGVAYIKLEAAGTLYYKTGQGFKSLEISE